MSKDKETEVVDELETETAETEVSEETKPGSETTDKAKGSEETKQPNPEYEKAKQQLDQERGNNRRAREALEEVETEKEQLTSQLAELKGQMTGLQKQLKDQLTTQEYSELAKLDPETTDVPELVKAFQAQNAKLLKLDQENVQMKEFIDGLRAKERQEQVTRARSATEEEIYSDCDEEFGSQFRNEAIKLADKLVKDGEVDAPKTQVQGIRLMRKCYQEVQKSHTEPKKGKSPVPTDTGLRGLSVTDIEDSEEFKPGTLDQVAADLGKKIKAGKWKKAFSSPP